MKMNQKHAQQFFEVVDADKSGGLSIGEFKDFLFSEDCKTKFRILMRRIR